MPAYISHSILGDAIYKQSLTDEKLFKIAVDRDSLRTYSCGIDLAEAKNKFIHNPHNYRTQDFILYMIKYIKDNNLTTSPIMLSFLYGHISHYFFDTQAHPFIYYIEKGCKQVGIISPHNLVEGYISAYLTEKILNKDIMQIKREYFNQADFNNLEINNIVSYLYGTIYNDPNIIKSYKLFKTTFTLVEWACKETLVTKNILIKFFSFDKFLKENNLSLEELNNESNMAWKHPITGKTYYESILDLYNKALEQSLYAIFMVNKYLYDKYSLSSFEKIFPNISYDTGIEINKSSVFTYTRKRK